MNMYTCGIVASALSDGSVAKFVEELRRTYSDRMRAAYEILEKNLPLSCKISLPEVRKIVMLL